MRYWNLVTLATPGAKAWGFYRQRYLTSRLKSGLFIDCVYPLISTTVVDVVSYCFGAYRADTSVKNSSTPKRGITFQRRHLRTYEVRRPAFNYAANLQDWFSWGTRNKQVNVIRHHFKSEHFDTMTLTHPLECVLANLLRWLIPKHWTPTARHQYNMIPILPFTVRKTF